MKRNTTLAPPRSVTSHTTTAALLPWTNTTTLQEGQTILSCCHLFLKTLIQMAMELLARATTPLKTPQIIKFMATEILGGLHRRPRPGQWRAKAAEGC